MCNLGVGATFGESVLSDMPRDSTVVMKTNGELLRVEQQDFRLIFEVTEWKLPHIISAQSQIFISFSTPQKNKDLMNDVIINSKFKNGSFINNILRIELRQFILFCSLVSTLLLIGSVGFASPTQNTGAVSPSKKQISPDHPNPALPIVEVSHISFSLPYP